MPNQYSGLFVRKNSQRFRKVPFCSSGTILKRCAREGKMIVELTKEQIQQQDFVDNAIHDMAQDLIKDHAGMIFNWDIEFISQVRDMTIAYFLEHGYLANEQDAQNFYPEVKEEK